MTYESAVNKAKEIAKALGSDWKPDIWENIGWHARAISPCGRLKVHVNYTGFTAFLGPDDFVGGRWAETSDTPAGAVLAVLKTARKELAEIHALIDGLEAW